VVSAQERSKTAKETTANALKGLDKGEKVLLIDVRNEDEVQARSIPGAINVPMDQLRERMKDIPKNVEIVFLCDRQSEFSCCRII
jgi:rhodanese-related sulfurtransferase